LVFSFFARYRAGIGGWIAAGLIAEASGSALVLQVRHSLLAVMMPYDYATEALLLLVSAGSALMVFHAQATGRLKVAPFSAALAWLRRPWTGRFDLPTALALLQGAAVVTALAVSLGFIFDPRYRDFPLAALVTPAIAFAWLAWSQRYDRLLAIQDRREEALLSGLLFLASLLVAVREGPLNLVALGWAATALLLALPLLPALRALRIGTGDSGIGAHQPQQAK